VQICVPFYSRTPNFYQLLARNPLQAKLAALLAKIICAKTVPLHPFYFLINAPAFIQIHSSSLPGRCIPAIFATYPRGRFCWNSRILGSNERPRADDDWRTDGRFDNSDDHFSVAPFKTRQVPALPGTRIGKKPLRNTPQRQNPFRQSSDESRARSFDPRKFHMSLLPRKDRDRSTPTESCLIHRLTDHSDPLSLRE
jgi:hypothetical protein